MSVSQTQGVGVPRLQELSFLEEAIKIAAAEGTYDQIRTGLIAWMEATRDGPAASGRYMGVRRKPGAGGRQETRFMDNATEALAELMRLGWLERTTLPTTASALPAHSHRKFAVTPAGHRWIDQLGSDHEGALEHLLSEMWPIHPQLSGYYTLVAESSIIVPTLSWTDLYLDGAERFGSIERKRYLHELATFAAEAADGGELGWNADDATIRARVEAIVEKRLARARRRGTPDPYARPQDFTRDCHKALVALAFERAGVRLDSITQEILRRWGRELGIANFSYHVPDPLSALRCWGTAQVDVSHETVSVERRRTAEYGGRVVEELPKAYKSVREAQGGGGFVPIYELRQLVCWRLGLNGQVFDRAIRELLQNRRKAPFSLTLDRGFAGKVPPTEAPLVLHDSHERASNYLLIMLTPTDRRSQ